MGIDFNRIMKDVKEEIEFGKVLFMSEEKRDEYYRNRQAKAERRFYDEGGPHHSNRQLYMMKMITTPLIQEGLMPYLQKTTEVGGSYQPSVDTPLVFVPEYNDHVSLYYKSHKLFDLQFKDEYGKTIEGVGIKSYTIADQHAKQVLAAIPNSEWDAVIDKVVPEIIADSTHNVEYVMRNKCDTPYIVGLKDVLAKRGTLAERVGYKEEPNSHEQVSSISDEDLNRMYEEFLQSKDSKSSSVEHEYGGY